VCSSDLDADGQPREILRPVGNDVIDAIAAGLADAFAGSPALGQPAGAG